MRTRHELSEFIESLPIPRGRREIVRMELEDHVFETMAELEAFGVESAEAERRAIEALGRPEDVRARLVRAEAAFSISPAQARWLGARTGLAITGAALLAGAFDRSPPWDAPTGGYFLVVGVALLAAFPWRAVRPFLAAHERAVAAGRAGDEQVAVRLHEPLALFFAAFVITASGPLFAWILASAMGVPLGAAEGLLLRTVFAAFMVSLPATAIASMAAWRSTPPEKRWRIG